MAQDAGKLDRIPTPPSFPINYNNILFKNLGTSVYNVFIFYRLLRERVSETECEVPSTHARKKSTEAGRDVRLTDVYMPGV